ncbi:MAG: sugar phosphate isomerase/epimerase family protein [Salibacteraceae bacterium]
MIYVSTACVRTPSIRESVAMLVAEGYHNIELSGGTETYPELVSELLELQEKHNLRYLCHNYFPPPSEHFVLNLAAQAPQLYRQSTELALAALVLSEKLGAKKYAVHAGFLMNFRASELGKPISRHELNDEQACLQTFRRGWEWLQEHRGLVEVYIENNVLSIRNAATYAKKNPLLFTHLQEWELLKGALDMRPLVDVAHLKVSVNSHNAQYGRQLSFEKELEALLPLTDYVHVSDNDGRFDQGKAIYTNSELVGQLGNHDFTGKVLTIEVSESLEAIRTSFETIQNLPGVAVD